MCTAGAGQQTATIKTTTTKEQEDKGARGRGPTASDARLDRGRVRGR
jgi:hypothetical protein